MSSSLYRTRRPGITSFADYFPLQCLWILLSLTPTHVEAGDAPATEVRIGGLFGADTIEDPSYVALRLAINYVNKRLDILPNVTLTQVTSGSSTDGIFDTMKRACSLVQQGPVVVVGPTTTDHVKAVSAIFTSLHLPYISPGASDPTLSLYADQFTYLFKMNSPDFFQAAAIVDIINHFGWKRIGIVGSSTDYGRNGLTFLQSESLKRGWVITSIAYFEPSCNMTETLRPLLITMKGKGTRVVVLNSQAKYARYVLDEAFSLGMLHEGWVWITTDGVTSMEDLFNSCADVPLHLQGIIGLRPTQSEGALYSEFYQAWTNDTSLTPDQDYVVNVFDAVLVTSYALQRYLADGHVLTAPRFDEDTCSRGQHQPWSEGQLFAEYLANASGDGVAHHLNFTELRYPSVTKYEVVNLRRKGWRKVGEWLLEGDGGRLDMEDPILFSGMTGNVPVDTAVDLRNVNLRVVTILEEPFTMETKDTNITGEMKYEGYCIDLLNKLQETLGFQYELYIVPDGQFGVRNPDTGRWNGMIGEIVYGRADLAVASLTINYEREQAVGFTKPFQDLGNLILMAKESSPHNIFAFLDPFSTRLWLVLGAALLVCGIVTTVVSWLSPFGTRGAYVSGLEPAREKYKPERNVLNLWNSLWLTFSVWSMQGAEVTPKCLSGRLVYGAWYFTVMVISATYTANLAAFLTVQRLDSGISSLTDLANQDEIKYGTMFGAATHQFFKIQVTNPYKTVYKFMEEHNTYVWNNTAGLEMVRDSYGKPRSERYAYIYDSIPLEYAANQEPCHITTIGRLFNNFGYGLALQKNSPFVEVFSLQILKLRQSGFLSSIYAKWVLSGTCQISAEETGSDAAKQMTLVQMIGVFILMAGILILALLVVFFEYCAAAGMDVKKDTSLSFCGALSRRSALIRTDVRQNIATCICCQSDHESQQSGEVPRDEFISGYDISAIMSEVNEGFVADNYDTYNASASAGCSQNANNSSMSKL